MKNKIIYSFILICSISLIASARKTSDCSEATCCRVKPEPEAKKSKTESKAELSSLSLFFFHI
ncbi:MAG TPA: hypothetical protein VFP97_06830 [Chitinophagaceae bacterium]|nr:hypothetical protein [Chitinophagaceae bacterium]